MLERVIEEQAKGDPLRAEANEDAFVVLPGRAYAVIDGVSDRTGMRYDGELSGRHAARLVGSRRRALTPRRARRLAR